MQRRKIARKEAESILSVVRYPGESRLICRETLWRWCNIAGIPTRLTRFDSDQFKTLRRIAELLSDGYSYDQIQSLLSGEPTHGKQQRIRPESQPQGDPQASTGGQWSIFFGG